MAGVPAQTVDAGPTVEAGGCGALVHIDFAPVPFEARVANTRSGLRIARTEFHFYVLGFSCFLYGINY